MAQSGFGSEPTDHPAADPVNDALIPAFLICAMWCFGWYVLAVREALYTGGNELLQYVYFFFVVATVLIAKIRSVRGNEARASVYMAALSAAMGLVILRFGLEAGSVSTAPDSAVIPVAMYGLAFALAGVGINWISRDCTVDPASEETATGTWFDPVPRDKRRPGRAVVVFSLIAACVFGAGQLVLARTSTPIYHRGILCAAGYASCAMLLLALTNLSGIRLYVASRQVRAPLGMVPYWLAASAALAGSALGLAWVLPKSGGHAGQSILATAPGWYGEGGPTTPLGGSPVSGIARPEGNAPGGETGREHSPTGPPRGSGEGGQASASDSSEAPPAPSTSGERRVAGGGSEQGAGEPRPGQEDREPSPTRTAENQRTGAGDGAEGQEQTPKDPENASDGEERGQEAASAREDDAAPPKGEEGRPGEEPEEPQGPPPGGYGRSRYEGMGPSEEWLHEHERQARAEQERARPESAPALDPAIARVLLWLLVAAVGGMVLYQVLRLLARLRGAHLRWPAIPLPRRRARRSPGEFENPFASRALLEQMSPRDVVLHTYSAFMGLARACGASRPPQATATEFLRALPPNLAGLKQEAGELSELYLRAEYAPDSDLSAALPRLREIWSRMEEFLAAWQRPAGQHQTVNGRDSA